MNILLDKSSFLYNQNIVVFGEFIDTNFISSLLGGFLATLLFWLFFENRIRILLDYKEKTRICRNFLEEMFYNRVVAGKHPSSMKDKNMTVVKFKTKAVEEFLSMKPIDLDDDYYSKLQIFQYSNLESINMLIDIHWFGLDRTPQDRENDKRQIRNNVSKVIEWTNWFTQHEVFVKEINKMDLIDDVKS